MESACRGAKSNGGITIGILPTYEKDSANPWVDIIFPTGLGHARNNLVVATADGVIGVGGSWGTLSELAIAVKMGMPVAVLAGWSATGPKGPGKGLVHVNSAVEAVSVALGEDPDQLRIPGV